MRHRLLALAVVGLFAIASCGGSDDSSMGDGTGSTDAATTEATGGTTAIDDTVIDDTTAAEDTTTEATITATLPEPAAVLEPTLDPTQVVGEDVATSLASLQFPRTWVLPDDGPASVVRATAQHSRGGDDGAVYTTFATAYTVPAGDIEVIAAEWAHRFADALGISGIERLGVVSNDTSEAISWSTLGDAEPGKPDLEVVAAHGLAEASGSVTVVARMESVDISFPDLVMPLDFDPTLPPLAGCTASRFDVDYDGYHLPNEVPDDPTYTIWWEGDCPGLDAFDIGLAWANANGADLGESTTSYNSEATSEDDVTVELNGFHTDDDNSRMTLIVTQPLAGEG